MVRGAIKLLRRANNMSTAEAEERRVIVPPPKSGNFQESSFFGAEETVELKWSFKGWSFRDSRIEYFRVLSNLSKNPGPVRAAWCGVENSTGDRMN